MPEERGFQAAVAGRQAMDCPFYVRRKEKKRRSWYSAKRENCTTCRNWDLWYSECGREEELKEWGVNKE
jgi:ribosome modulation factor